MSNEKIKKYFGIELKEASVGSQKYYFQTAIFYTVVIIMLTYTIYVLALNNFDKTQHFYIRCPSNNSVCYNSLYHEFPTCEKVGRDFDFCNTQYLPAGFEYGIKPPAVLQAFGNYAVILVLLGFLTNHLIYNRHFSFKKAINEDRRNEND